MKKINPLFLSGCLFFSLPAISATLSGTLAPTVVPLANGGQANIAVSNTDPNLFTVPGDRITAINSLDGGLTNQEQTDSGGAILATVSKKPFTFIVETERYHAPGLAGLSSWSPSSWGHRVPLNHGKNPVRMKAFWFP